jgi:N-acyl-phosphatidylethanolamine-hydrolysing phospholipase D
VWRALPPIHFVVISHDRYDHLDLPTVKRRNGHAPAALPRPLGMKAWFAENGIAEVDELDWWEVARCAG